MQRARSRLHRKKDRRLQRMKVELIVLSSLLLIYFGGRLLANIAIFHPVPALANNDHSVVVVEKKVEVIKEVEVDRTFTSEKQQIYAYLVEKFGDRADDAIVMIRNCENGTFDPRRVSPLNIQKSGRRSYDVGVMQINVDEHNAEELEKLKDYKYNIDQGYKKYKASGNTFYHWTCGNHAGDYTYVDALKGKKK